MAPDLVIADVGEADLPDLLPLMRGYCEFYDVAPADHDLLDLSRALIADPDREGVQLLARRVEVEPERPGSGTAVGFATVFWSWSTLIAGRIGVMNDLFVVPEARGERVGQALIAACLERCRRHGARSLGWQTARDNVRAQALYDRTGALREEWFDYSLEV